MTHQLTLELPDDIYKPLSEQAAAAGQTVAAMAQACLVQAVQRRPGYGKLRSWAGAFSSRVTDAGQHHDDHLGEALYEELQGLEDA